MTILITPSYLNASVKYQATNKINQQVQALKPIGTPHSSFLKGLCSRARLAPSQWETSLQSNAISHWLGTSLESALHILHPQTTMYPQWPWSLDYQVLKLINPQPARLHQRISVFACISSNISNVLNIYKLYGNICISIDKNAPSQNVLLQDLTRWQT